MTQTQFVTKLADACKVSKKVSRQFLDSLATTAVKEVKSKGVFIVPGLGRLVRVDRKARIGRNPATGEQINIPAKKVVKFRVAKAAKNAIVPVKSNKAVV
jgi:DNA-binding protein HU-beta